MLILTLQAFKFMALLFCSLAFFYTFVPDYRQQVSFFTSYLLTQRKDDLKNIDIKPIRWRVVGGSKPIGFFYVLMPKTTNIINIHLMSSAAIAVGLFLCQKITL